MTLRTPMRGKFLFAALGAAALAFPGTMRAESLPSQVTPAKEFPSQVPSKELPAQVPSKELPSQVPTQQMPSQVPGKELPPAGSQVPYADVQTGVSLEQETVSRLYTSNLVEIEMSRLVLSKSVSEPVARFARTLIEDHTRANRQLMAVARNLRIQPMQSRHVLGLFSPMRNRLAVLEGAALEREFLSMNVVAHQQAIEEITSVLPSLTRTPQLANLLQSQLPHLIRHRAIAVGLLQERR